MTDKSIRRTEKFMRHAMAAHGGSVYLVALAQTRSEADAQDVARDVFCRLLTDDTAFTSDEHLRAEPVWQALQSLPEKLRVVALLHCVEEYTTKEIARIVGSPPATVRTRRTFVRAGAVAAGGVAAFLGANALMNHAAGKRGNWFALTAYAEGTEEPDGSRLALGETFGGHIGWSGGVDPATNGNDLIMASTELNLSCTGDNVGTLTYRLEGDSVGTDVDVYSKPGIWIFQSDYEGSGPVASFTVDYDSQDTQSLQALLTGRAAYYAVYANIPVPDDLVPVFLELQEIGEAQIER